MDSNRLLFSVIIPVYNTSKEYLDDCIGSLTVQPVPDMEIILVDDGSRPECAALCDSYGASDSRIRVIHQENQGVSAARNHGIREAKADWIMFVDADDWVEPDTCQRVKALLEVHPCDILMFGGIKEYTGRQTPLVCGFEPGTMYEMQDNRTREFLYRRGMQGSLLSRGWTAPVYYSCDKVFRRSFLVDNDLQYPVGLAKSEDKVFMLSCFEKLDRLYYSGDPLYHYRVNSASACNRYSPRADADQMMMARLISQIAGRMDRELEEKMGVPGYDRITRECQRFLFGILTDALMLKFHHPDCPWDRRQRNAEAKKFLETEPFRSAIRACSYGSLSTEAKLKKLLLTMGMSGLFCKIRRTYMAIQGKTAE